MPAYGGSAILFVMTVSIYDISYVVRPPEVAQTTIYYQGISLDRRCHSMKNMSG